MPLYRRALAAVHDAGFLAPAENAAKELLCQLRVRGVSNGVIVDLGCGSGRLLEIVTAEGFSGVGIEPSPHFIERAAARVPVARFVQASLYDAALPPAVAVTAIGEVFNYLPERDTELPDLLTAFRRVRAALSPGAVFLFDVALSGRVPEGHVRRKHAGEGWSVEVELTEDATARRLRRDILACVDGEPTERETHWLRLFTDDEVRDALTAAAFRVTSLDAYADFRFLPGWQGYLGVAEG